MTDQETMMKSSKTSLLFAQAHNIERFKGATKVNPSEFTPEELQAFEDFKRQKKEERMHAHYEKRKSEGTLTKKTATADMTEEQLQHARDISRRNALRINYRKRHPDTSKEEIESMVQKYIDDHPREGDDKMKSGPQRGSTMTATKKRKVGSEMEGTRPIGRPSGVNYLELFLQEHPEAPRVQRSDDLPQELLLQYHRFCVNTKEEAVRKPPPVPEPNREPEPQVDTKENEGPRPKGKISGVNYLELFFKENPGVPKVERPVDFPYEVLLQYRRFCTNYNGRVRYHENPEAARQKQRDKERFRASRYRDESSAGTIQHQQPKYASREEELNSVEYRWENVKSSAKQKGRELELTKEDVAVLCVMPCYYCGIDPNEIGTRFGIDRVDNTVGYTRANSVTCCTPCNYAKKDYHLYDFLRGMCNVGHTLCPEEDRDDSYSVTYTFLKPNANKRPTDFSEYRHAAYRRALEFNITLGQFDTMVRAPCYYCGRDDHVMGLDRVDNAEGYNEQNCVACCSMCNSLKGPRDLDLFLYQALAIYKSWRNKVPIVL
jgi:hypothetical protein